MRRFAVIAVALAALAGCRDRYELLLARGEEDAEESCTVICYRAVSSADTDAEGDTSSYDLLGCQDVDYRDGREMVECSFMIWQ